MKLPDKYLSLPSLFAAKTQDDQTQDDQTQDDQTQA
jgi:hypothetical protein